MANQFATSSVLAPEDVVNNSLRRIGFKKRVGNLFDGSDQANTVLDVYGQTRDATLREFPWGFAGKIVTAAVSSDSPPAIWGSAYTYPNDCLQIRNIYGPAYVFDHNNPIPVQYTIGQGTSGKEIWCNISSATLVYTSRVTDMTQWDPLFVEAVCGALGRRLVAVLGVKELAKMTGDDEQGEFQIASSVLG